MDLEFGRFRSALLLLACGILFIGVRIYLIDTYGVMTPFWDDWGIAEFLNRSITTGLSFSDFYKDANEHRMFFNRVLTLLLFNANQQQWDPMVSMLANSVLWTLSGVFLLHVALQHQKELNIVVLVFMIIFFWSVPFAIVNVIWGIQTHTYTMILFSLLGCWYSGYPNLSFKWWLGILCLGAACLTLAGGTFAAFSVVTIQILILFSNSDRSTSTVVTMIASALVGLFGVMLIISQDSSSLPSGKFDLMGSLGVLLTTLSWPAANQRWPVFIFILPVLILLITAYRNRTINQPLIRFTLSLYGFVAIIALGIAYAREGGAIGPARRYFEFLSLMSVASFMALLLLTPAKTRISQSLLTFLSATWIGLFIHAMPWQSYLFDYTIEDNQILQPNQKKLLKNYLNTSDKTWFENKPFRHVPFPIPDLMDDILDDLNASDMLPYKFQTPNTIKSVRFDSAENVQKTGFYLNGTFKMSTNQIGLIPFGETVFGSYHPASGGMKATGSFLSDVFEINRPYVSIAVTGYFGYPNTGIQLVNVLSGKKITLAVNELDSKYAEVWRDIIVKVPRGYYQLTAYDNNESLWFGFSTPRTVGRLSYWTQKILDNYFWFWRIAIVLILICLADPISRLFTRRNAARHT